MRIVYLTTLYPDYVRQFYTTRPELLGESFGKQRAALNADGFGWNGAWNGPMSRAGHDYLEISVNVRALQVAWLRESGQGKGTPAWKTSIPLMQIKEFQPDVILTDDLRNFSRDWYRALRVSVPSIRGIVGFLTSPSVDLGTLRECDIQLCLLKHDVDRINRSGGRARVFLHGYNTEMDRYLSPAGESSGKLSFCGSILRGPGYHIMRASVLEYLVKARVPIDIYAPEYELSRARDFVRTGLGQTLHVAMRSAAGAGIPRDRLRRIPLVGKAANWREPPTRQYSSRLRPALRPPAYGVSQLRAMRRSAATLNIHGDVAGDEAVNVRLFEATGAGACLLTDFKSNLHKLFDTDSEIATFSSPEECVSKAKWLLNHPKDAIAMATAARARVMREHTLDHRMGTLESAMQEAVSVRANR